MTFREKLAQEHPECVDSRLVGGCSGCPEDYGYELEYDCGGTRCRDCWNRQMPMTPEEQEAQEKHDLEINAEIIRGYCSEYLDCDGCPADVPCSDLPGCWSAGVSCTSAAKQRAVLDAFEAALPPLDESDGGRPQAAPTEGRGRQVVTEGNPRSGAAPTEENATPERERDVRERLDYLFWEASGKLKAWYETRDREELEQALWLLRWMTEIQEGET